MIRIAILDDDRRYIEIIHRITKKVMEELGTEYDLVDYHGTDTFLLDLKKLAYYDIYLLDMELPGMSGLEVARRVREMYREPTIIYITNYVEYAIEAFEVNAFRYIPKVCLEEKLREAYKAFVAEHESMHDSELTIYLKDQIMKISLWKIIYVEKFGKYVKVVPLGNKEGYLIRMTLQELLDKLRPEQFLLIHKSYAVNLRHIKYLNKQEIGLVENIKLSVSKPRLPDVRQEIMKYMEERQK